MCDRSWPSRRTWLPSPRLGPSRLSGSTKPVKTDTLRDRKDGFASIAFRHPLKSPIWPDRPIGMAFFRFERHRQLVRRPQAFDPVAASSPRAVERAWHAPYGNRRERGDETRPLHPIPRALELVDRVAVLGRNAAQGSGAGTEGPRSKVRKLGCRGWRRPIAAGTDRRYPTSASAGVGSASPAILIHGRARNKYF